jgi:ADP-ribose pyrophosphatase
MSSSSTHTTHPFTEQMQDTQPCFQGKVISVKRDTVSLPNGKAATREVVMHPGGVTILPLLPNGNIVFVEQYRYATGQVLLELPAGKLDPGETPLFCGQRELAEETLYTADHWELLSVVYTAPGFCDERLWLYLAKDIQPVPAQSVERPEDEFLNVIILTPQQAWQKVKSQEIIDAKTISALSLGFISAL